MKPKSKAQAYFANACEPGSIGADFNADQRKAWRLWLKQEDRDRHFMERMARRDGWCITPAGRD